jgi:hypothetical protein
MSTHTEQNEDQEARSAAAGMTGSPGAQAPLADSLSGGGATALGSEGMRLLELQSRHVGFHKPLEEYSEKVKVLLGWL